MAIVLPINREIDYFVSTKLLSRSTGVLDESEQTSIAITVNVNYAFHLSVILGTKASMLTSFCIIALDFTLNLKSAYKIFRLHAMVNPDHLENQIRMIEMKQKIRKLCFIEIIEMMVPISYIITFLIAYYGPNADLLGNIRSNYWQYNPVEDVGKLVETVFSLFIVDFSSGVFGGILLSTIPINMLREGSLVLKCHWPLITLSVACGLYIVSYKCKRHY